MEQPGQDQGAPESVGGQKAVAPRQRGGWRSVVIWLLVLVILSLCTYIYLHRDDLSQVDPSSVETAVDTSSESTDTSAVTADVSSNDDVATNSNATSSATQSNSASVSTTSWRSYTNTTLGFALTFTDAWEGYKAEPEKNTTKVVHFYAPNTDGTYTDIFAIVRQTSGEYQTSVANNEPVGSVIYQDPNWVYTRQHRFDMYETSKLKHNIAETDILAVINSFQKL